MFDGLSFDPFSLLDEFPRTPSMKVSQLALRELFEAIG
jgi:acyl-coenzyme A synthetase/AMP-(fatty) acid ligase